MKTEYKARLISIFIIAILDIVAVINMRDYISISKIVGIVLVLSVVPVILLLINSKSRLSSIMTNTCLLLIALWGIVYLLYFRRPLGALLSITCAVAFACRLIFPPLRRKDKRGRKLAVICVMLLCIGMITYLSNHLLRIENYATTNGSAAMWNEQLEKYADELCADADTPEQKVQVIYQWIIANISYDDSKDMLYQYFSLEDTMASRSGLCYDYACLFTAMCRSQGIPCVSVDGYDRKNPYNQHAWNRVYYNGSWWNLDVTHDANSNNKTPYGFHKLCSYDSPSDEFIIMRIY